MRWWKYNINKLWIINYPKLNIKNLNLNQNDYFELDIINT